MPILLWVVTISLLVVDIILRLKGIEKMQELTDALATLNSSIASLQTGAGTVVSPAQATAIATSIRQAATAIDGILPAQ